MKIGIIGGGASGLAAGVLAGRLGLEVTIYERKDRVGKKLLATGNGRCNLSNIDLDTSHFHSSQEGFFKPALKALDRQALADFFSSLGLDLVADERGRVYPITLQARTVLNLLRKALDREGVQVRTQALVESILPQGDGFIIRGQGWEDRADKIILAGGGRTLPSSGSDGRAYSLARDLGHRMVRTIPAIAGLVLDWPYLKQVQGVKVQARVRLLKGQKEAQVEEGEVLFTREGVSGPPILDLARRVNQDPGPWTLALPLINFLDQAGPSYREGLIGRVYSHPSWTLYDLLQGILAKPLIIPILKDLGLDQGLSLDSLDYQDIQTLIDSLLETRIPVTGTWGYDRAQVTCGGLDTRDFDPVSLESKLVPGLFATGEILDVDGDCGGYNLHWAWASAQAVISAMARTSGQ